MPSSLTGGPDGPPDLRTHVERNVHLLGRNAQVRLTFPYATRSGLDALIRTTPPWDTTTPSKWVIGIHEGLTEPAALRRILDLPAAELRLFVPTRTLNRAALVATPRIHAKVVLVGPRRAHLPASMVVGSANLTGAALGPRPLNYELGASLRPGELRRADATRIARWWRQIVAMSRVADATVINRYATLRNAFHTQFPDILTAADPPSIEDISSARYLWVHTGAMMGPPQHRHQIEFAEELAAYFRAPRENVQLSMRVAGHPVVPRKLTYRGTSRGQYVAIWRLGLPTPAMGGPLYQHRVVRFTRLESSGTLVYAIDVDNLDGARARRWQRDANRRGYVGRTGAPQSPTRRHYGFYS